MSFTSDLLEGVAQHLHNAGAGTYRADGPYTSGETAIVFRALPPNPDRSIALATYDLVNDPTLSDSLVGLQTRIRGTTDPFVDQDIDDACFDALQGLQAVALGAVTVVSVERVSGASLGADTDGRFGRTSNYQILTHRPSPHRT